MAPVETIPTPAPAPIAPLAHVKERLELSATTAHDAELARLMSAITAAFESVSERLIVKRDAAVVYLDGCDVPIGWPLTIESATPALSVATVHIDTVAAEPHLVVFDATTLVDSADYRLRDPSMVYSWAPTLIDVAAAQGPNGRGVGNVRVALACGYTPDDGSGSFTVPAGELAMPAGIVEAFVQQAEIVWRRRGETHVGTAAFSSPGGGGGTRSYWSTKLARSVKELLLPHATPVAALNLGEGFGASAAGQA